MSVKKCVIAGAGTGKTTYLLKLALNAPETCNVLYLTYTEAASAHFETQIKHLRGAVPSNITIMTWFSFLLSQGVRPFPYPLPGFRPKGIQFTEGKVKQQRGVRRGQPAYYITDNQQDVFSSRLADLACMCDEQVNGAVVTRISDIYQLILVDEAQDLSSYDYDYVEKLLRTPSSIVIVGDPRQRTYTTSNEGAHLNETIFDYIANNKLCEIDRSTLTTCYRCKPDVIELANELFPDLPALQPSDGTTDEYVKVLTKEEFSRQAANAKFAMHLTWQSKSLPISGCQTMTMGASKGSEFSDVAVWLTQPMSKWLVDRKSELKATSRAKLYVAITRSQNNLWLIKP